jgi:hypothetical protein
MAQSFKPTVTMVTKVELIIFNRGSPQGNFTVSIRENLSSIDYTSITIPVADIPQGFYPEVIWTEFDFQDVFVETVHTYYIVCRYDVQSNPNLTCWGITDNNYLRGEMWTWNNQRWESNEDHDFCFKTYGYNETGFISRIGFVSIDAIIKEKYVYENESIYMCQPVEEVTFIGFGIKFPQDHWAHFYMSTFTNISVLSFVSSKNFEVSDEYQHISLFVTHHKNIFAFDFERNMGL